MFSFAGQRVSVETPQLYHFLGKAAGDNLDMDGPGCVPIKLYLKKQVVGWRSGPGAVVC